MCLSPQSAEFDESMQKLVDTGLAIARGDQDPRVFVDYAAALWDVRDLDSTVAALDCAIAGKPRLPIRDLARAYASRSIAQLQRGNIAEAEADATASLELIPRAHPFGLRGLIRYHKGDYPAALGDAQEALRYDPDDWELRAWRGQILLKLGRHAQALPDIDFALASHECVRYASELHLDRARAYLALGQPAVAENDCTEAIDQDYHEQSHWPFIVRERASRSQDAYLLRAEARLALGQHARALGDCFWAASIAPGDARVYEMRARVNHAIGNFREVIDDTIRTNVLRAGMAEAAPAREPALVS